MKQLRVLLLPAGLGAIPSLGYRQHRVWKGGSEPAFPLLIHENPASRNFFIAIPNFASFYSPGHKKNWIHIVSCNLIGSDAEPEHWLDRERTKFQINFLVEEIQNAWRITVKINLSTDKSRRFYLSKDSIHRYQDTEGP